MFKEYRKPWLFCHFLSQPDQKSYASGGEKMKMTSVDGKLKDNGEGWQPGIYMILCLSSWEVSF